MYWPSVCVLIFFQRLMCRYRYKSVVTFGGWKDDFMLVVNQSIMRGGATVEQGTQRLLFVMSREKVTVYSSLNTASSALSKINTVGTVCPLQGGVRLYLIFNNYSTSVRWIWVNFNHLVSNKLEWNNCFIKTPTK